MIQDDILVQELAKAIRLGRGCVSRARPKQVHAWRPRVQLWYERAVRHFLISAKMGDKDSLDNIKDMFAKFGALKGYQDSVEEMASPERVDAYTKWKEMKTAR